MKRNSFNDESESGGPVRRPRVDGDRRREIFRATMDLLCEVGYDRLTIDAVATRVKVSKATVYRLWGDKSALVDAAIGDLPQERPDVPDTGSLRGDLVALTSMPGFFEPERAALISALATAVHREPERLDAVRRRLVHDGTKHVRAVLERAVARGDLGAGVDIELMSSLIPAMVLFHMTYETVGSFGPRLVEDVVETFLLPALNHSSHEEGKREDGPATRR